MSAGELPSYRYEVGPVAALGQADRLGIPSQPPLVASVKVLTSGNAAIC